MTKYHAEHTWVRTEGDFAWVGITVHAQETLGDIVFVELPAIGASFAQGTVLGVVESVKAASDIYAPVSGEVIAINDGLADSPESVNSDPYGSWFFKLKPSDASELDKLLDAVAYKASADSDA